MPSYLDNDDPFEFDTCARDERRSPTVRQSRGHDGRFVELMDGVVDDDEPVETGVPDGFFLLITGREAFAVGCFLTDVEVDVPEEEMSADELHAAVQEREELLLLETLEAESAEIDEKLNELHVELNRLYSRLAKAKVAAMDSVDSDNDDHWPVAESLELVEEAEGEIRFYEPEMENDPFDDLGGQVEEVNPPRSSASFHQEGATAKFGKKWDRVREAHCPKPIRPKGSASVRRMEVAM